MTQYVDGAHYWVWVTAPGAHPDDAGVCITAKFHAPRAAGGGAVWIIGDHDALAYPSEDRLGDENPYERSWRWVTRVGPLIGTEPPGDGREAIVRWLRAEATPMTETGQALIRAAKSIERGEHLATADKGQG